MHSLYRYRVVEIDGFKNSADWFGFFLNEEVLFDILTFCKYQSGPRRIDRSVIKNTVSTS